ncbi:MAG: YihY/virulence factor BrkB family protein [Phycicoccus sp.]|nr:YihY/virulence factor BrkB family protein [Phycicoccus sp.]
MSRIATLWDRVKATRLWGVWQTYSGAQANLLAGGVGYFAFFSVFPAVLLAFTVFGYVLRDRPELLEQVKDGINQALPGFVQTQANPDGIISVEPPSTASLSVSGVVSVLGLVYTGTGWLSALRTAFQIILDVPATATNFVVGKGRDLAVLALLGVAFVVSAVLSAVAGSTARALADLIGLGQISWLLSGLSLVLSVVLDASIVALMLRLLPGARLPWSRLRGAALVGGLGLTALKRLGTLLLSGTLDNPLYASFAVVVGLLVWLNLMSRVILLAAAWAAYDPHTAALPSGESASQASENAEATDPASTGPVADTADPVALLAEPASARLDTGRSGDEQRHLDRVSIMAGAVVGATMALCANALRRVTRRS